MMLMGPYGDSIGRVRDVVVTIYQHRSHVLGLVIALPNKRQIFLPMLRVASINPSEVMATSSSVNLKPFQSRSGEISIQHELVGAKVHTDDPEHAELHGQALEIVDVELKQSRTRDWEVSRVAVAQRGRLGRLGKVAVVPLSRIQGLSASGTGPADSNAELLASFQEMHAADIAIALNDLPEEQQTKLAREIPNERLADVVAELPEDSRIAILNQLGVERAAEVLEEMEPDDAADALAELPTGTSDVLLELMDPEDSAPVRRLMSFSADTVGGVMTSEAIILTPQATVAEALAHARNPDVSSSLSSLVFVVRPPQSTPTGHYLGCVHLQKLLRHPPATLVSELLDLDLPALSVTDSHETAARFFATYNLVCAPVVDEGNHLLGVLAVDDLLDALLPEDWRDQDWRVDNDAQQAPQTSLQEGDADA